MSARARPIASSPAPRRSATASWRALTAAALRSGRVTHWRSDRVRPRWRSGPACAAASPRRRRRSPPESPGQQARRRPGARSRRAPSARRPAAREASRRGRAAPSPRPAWRPGRYRVTLPNRARTRQRGVAMTRAAPTPPPTPPRREEGAGRRLTGRRAFEGVEGNSPFGRRRGTWRVVPRSTRPGGRARARRRRCRSRAAAQRRRRTSPAHDGVRRDVSDGGDARRAEPGRWRDDLDRSQRRQRRPRAGERGVVAPRAHQEPPGSAIHRARAPIQGPSEVLVLVASVAFVGPRHLHQRHDVRGVRARLRHRRVHQRASRQHAHLLARHHLILSARRAPRRPSCAGSPPAPRPPRGARASRSALAA